MRACVEPECFSDLIICSPIKDLRRFFERFVSNAGSYRLGTGLLRANLHRVKVAIIMNSHVVAIFPQ